MLNTFKYIILSKDQTIYFRTICYKIIQRFFHEGEGHLSAMFVQLILTSLQLIIVSQFNDDEILKIMNDDIVSLSSRLCTLLNYEMQRFKKCQLNKSSDFFYNNVFLCVWENYLVHLVKTIFYMWSNSSFTKLFKT